MSWKQWTAVGLVASEGWEMIMEPSLAAATFQKDVARLSCCAA